MQEWIFTKLGVTNHHDE